jgi:tetratricopeptide (TPR) repeat protein
MTSKRKLLNYIMQASSMSRQNTYGNLWNQVEYEVLGRLVTGLISREKILGPDISRLFTTNAPDIICNNPEMLADASAMFRQVVVHYERLLGTLHPKYLDTVNNLSLLYLDQGKLIDAEVMLEQVLTSKANTLGLGHESTLETLHSLGFLYVEQGRLAEAESMFRMALDGKTRTLSPEDLSTARTAFWLYKLYTIQGKVIDADEILPKTFAWTEEPLFGHYTCCDACLKSISGKQIHYHCFVCGNFDLCSSCTRGELFQMHVNENCCAASVD